VIGFDYTDRIDPAALKAAGCSVVFRYLSQPGWPKNLELAESRELLAAGIPIVLNYETTATFMRGGYAAGIAAARSARAQANALGAPAAARIYYSADFDMTAAETSIVMAFLRGAASVDGAAEVDAYGGLRLARAAEAAGMRPWQTVAWSGGVWDPQDVARQTGEQRTVGGVQVDVNEIIDLAALGAWGGPTTGDIVTPEDIQAIAAAVYAYGKEDVNLPTGVMHNVPLGNLAHGAWVSVNDPNGPVISRLSALEAQVKALAVPAVDVKALSAALAPLLQAGASADQIATAVVGHLAVTLAKG
jgi:hypothetical protein